jgi:hypothetical protein
MLPFSSNRACPCLYLHFPKMFFRVDVGDFGVSGWFTLGGLCGESGWRVEGGKERYLTSEYLEWKPISVGVYRCLNILYKLEVVFICLIHNFSFFLRLQKPIYNPWISYQLSDPSLYYFHLLLCFVYSCNRARLFFCGTAAANRPIVLLPDDTWVNIEQRWNDTDSMYPLEPRERIRKDSKRVEAKRKWGRSVWHFIFFLRGEEHLIVRRFPGNTRSSFW